MSADSSYSMQSRSSLSPRKKANKSTKSLNSIIKDYKILLGLNFLWILPYLPRHLFYRYPEDDVRFWKFLILLFKTFNSLLVFVILCYNDLLFPHDHAMSLTSSLYAVLSLAASWNMFCRRQRIIKAIQMVLVVTGEATPRYFKSRWNVHLQVAASLIGTAVFSSSVGLTSIQAYHFMNVTSASFLWYDVTEEYSGVFRMSLATAGTATFLSCAVVCGLTTLLSSTVYFHVGDIVVNFGIKLKKRFEYHPVNKHTLSDSLSMFQRIMELVHAVNDAFSASVLCVYGAMISIFFIGICAFRSNNQADASVIILVMSIFAFALYCFFSLTITGDRIPRKHGELRDMLTSCSNIAISSERNKEAIVYFSLMSTEMRSAELCVTGGSIFTISNGLILSVAGAMITYGVLIVHMD